MRIHIALVGGQPAPVYHGIVATQPDKVVYVYSKGSENQLKSLLSLINVPYDHSEPLDPTNPEVITERASQLAYTYKNDQIVLNITSGLKSWSHIFGQIFAQQPNAQIVYIDQNNILWNYTTMTHTVVPDCDIDIRFRLHGNPLKHFTRFLDYTKEDISVIDQIREVRSRHPKEFKDLTQVLGKDAKSNRKQLDMINEDETGCVQHPQCPQSSASWDRGKACAKLSIMWGSKMCEYTFSSPHAIGLLFNSGWFEVYVANILSHWSHTKEVFVNCIFPPTKMQELLKYPKNEVDVIVNTGQKTLFVECKTGVSNSTDIDKFRTVVNTYGGSSGKALFISDNRMNATSIEKCRSLHIMCFSFSSYPNITMAIKELYKLLDRELSSINV